MSHTPGPWHKARGRAFGLYDIRVAIPGSQDITGHPIAKAVSEEDADLIAAAPELLEALKRAVADCPCTLAADLLRSAQAAFHLCESLLACREGASDELIREVRDSLKRSITKAETL
jgi:hypothetical protein